MAPRRLGAAAAAVIVAVGAGVCAAAAAPAMGATTAFTVSGTEVLHPPPYPEALLPAYFAGDIITQIRYPAALFGMDGSIGIAAGDLSKAVDAADGPTVVAGFSQGAIAVTYEKKLLMSRPAAQRPAVDQLTFVTIGDPTGPGGIMRFLPFTVPFLTLTPIAAPETPYATVFVNGEYDPWGDFPDRPWNLVSVVNALFGGLYVHGHYEVIPGGLDLSVVPAENITVSTNSLGGTTTSYLIPTDKLPLLQPLRDIGIPEPIVAALEAPLKKIVDAGYIRNDTNPTKAAAAQPISPTRAVARQATVARVGPARTRTPEAASAPRRQAAATRAAAA